MMKILFTTFIIIFFFTSCYKPEEKEKYIESEKSYDYKILALWDSLTAWYNLDFQDSYPIQLENILNNNWYKYKVINAWVSWDTSKNLLSRISLYNEKYNLILLNIWWNDWLRSLDISELENNIKNIIEKFNNIKIVLFSIDLPNNYSEEYRNKLKDIYKKISLENNVIFYWSFFEWLDYKNHFLDDWLHPNKEWYKIIATKVYNFLINNNLVINDWN